MRITELIPEVRKRVNSIEGLEDDIKNVFICFLDDLSKTNVEAESLSLTMPMFGKLLERSGNGTHGVEILAFLLRPEVNFLKLEYFFIDDDGESEIISNEDIIEANETGYLNNPFTREHDHDYKRKVFPSLTITEEYLDNNKEGV